MASVLVDEMFDNPSGGNLIEDWRDDFVTLDDNDIEDATLSDDADTFNALQIDGRVGDRIEELEAETAIEEPFDEANTDDSGSDSVVIWLGWPSCDNSVSSEDLSHFSTLLKTADSLFSSIQSAAIPTTIELAGKKKKNKFNEDSDEDEDEDHSSAPAVATSQVIVQTDDNEEESEVTDITGVGLAANKTSDVISVDDPRDNGAYDDEENESHRGNQRVACRTRSHGPPNNGIGTIIRIKLKGDYYEGEGVRTYFDGYDHIYVARLQNGEDINLDKAEFMKRTKHYQKYSFPKKTEWK